MRNDVAVIIPTYRPGMYVEHCLRSLERQTLTRDAFCVYIGLNGEKEPYRTQLESFLSKVSFRYEFVYLEKAGVSAARNRLLDMAKERFVVFVDDDDVLSPGYLEALRNVTDDETMGIAVIRRFDKDVSRSVLHAFGETYRRLHEVETNKLRARNYFSSPWGKMFSKYVIGTIRFDEYLKNGEDSLFMTEISNRIRAVRKAGEEAVYFIRERPGSLSRRKRGWYDRVKVCCYLYRRYVSMLCKNGYDKIFILSRFAATFTTLVPEKLLRRRQKRKVQ